MAPSKADTLQGFLDAQALMLELFDAVEAADEGSLVLDVSLLMRMGKVVNALAAAHKALVFAYVLSGRAGDDLLASIRAELGEP